MSQQNNRTIATYNQSVEPYVNNDMMRSREGFYNDWIDDVFRDIPKTARILEIGSAQGRDAKYLMKKGYEVQLSDASEGFLEYLKEHGFDPIKLDIVADVPRGRWDVVYASAVFLHFTPEDFRKALQNIHIALRPGGKLTFTLIQGEGELTKDIKLGLARYFHYYSPDDLRALLEQSGFELDNIQSTDFKEKTWLYVTARKKGR